MPRPFSPATAEQVVSVVEAVVVAGRSVDTAFVAEFCDILSDRAQAALQLATDLKLLATDGTLFAVESPLCRVLSSPKEGHRAAAIRVVLEAYEPFLVFRARLPATPVAATAAQQTKVALDLTAHRDEIKDTLVSLGTYSQALVEEGGGLYRLADAAAENYVLVLAQVCADQAAAEGRVREQLGSSASASVSRESVIVPISQALLKATQHDAEGAVQFAGNAVESYLVEFAARAGVNLAGATGINGKLEKLATAAALPKKIVNMGKYLGHIRNAADHGIDVDVGAAWSIRSTTGIEFVFVACSFIAGCDLRERGGPFEI